MGNIFKCCKDDAGDYETIANPRKRSKETDGNSSDDEEIIDEASNFDTKSTSESQRKIKLSIHGSHTLITTGYIREYTSNGNLDSFPDDIITLIASYYKFGQRFYSEIDNFVINDKSIKLVANAARHVIVGDLITIEEDCRLTVKFEATDISSKFGVGLFCNDLRNLNVEDAFGAIQSNYIGYLLYFDGSSRSDYIHFNQPMITERLGFRFENGRAFEVMITGESKSFEINAISRNRGNVLSNPWGNHHYIEPMTKRVSLIMTFFDMNDTVQVIDAELERNITQ